MPPDKQRSILGGIIEQRRASREAANAGQRKLEEAALILGVPVSALTPSQRLQIAGLDDKAVTDAGKAIEDRERFKSLYGDNSPQVQAYDEMTQKAPVGSQSDIGGMRKEFTTLSKNFVTVRDAYNRVEASASNPSAAGDLALIFNYMKVLDPGSTVREGEFATAQNSAGIDGRIRSAYNRVINGERLNTDQRTDFVSRTRDLMGAQLKTQLELEEQYKEIAGEAGFPTNQVIVDFVGDLRRNAPVSTQPTSTDEPPKRRIRVDLEGNVIGGLPAPETKTPKAKDKKQAGASGGF